MNARSLEQIVAQLLTQGKGILAADESTGTADKRFAARGIPQNQEMRRKWRELLFITPGIETGLSGVILYDETIRQNSSDGTPLVGVLTKRGIMPGIKVDKGIVELENFPEEKVTEGLDGLSNRLAEYATMGAQFTKWRAVIKIGEKIPTAECLEANAYLLARYAAISQQAGLVPIVEPEVLIDGNHTLAQSETVLAQTLAAIFTMLKKYRIHLPGMILKSSMALPGKDSGVKAAPREIAEATLRAFKASVPPELPGIVFLSGGQTPRQATENLNEMVRMAHHGVMKTGSAPQSDSPQRSSGQAGRAGFPQQGSGQAPQVGGYPWQISFSYSRALQEPALEAWAGQEANTINAQEIFAARVRETALAREGKYYSKT